MSLEFVLKAQFNEFATLLNNCANMGDVKVTIEPLDVDNFSTWSFKVKNFLISRDLWQAIESDHKVDPSIDQKALATICLLVKEHHIPTLSGLNNAREAWDILEATYKSKTEARKMSLHQQLLHLNKAATEDVTQYICRAKQLRDDLIAAGEEPFAVNIINPILNGLPSAYTPLRLALSAQAGNITVEELQPRLISAKQLLSSEDTGSLRTTSTAFVARQHIQKKQHRCFLCDAIDHVVKDCRLLKEMKNKSVRNEKCSASNFAGSIAF